MASPEHNMAVGALWCIGGIAVTAYTYSLAASSPTGGHYLIAWGAILFGGLQFLKGLFSLGQSSEARVTAPVTSSPPPQATSRSVNQDMAAAQR